MLVTQQQLTYTPTLCLLIRVSISWIRRSIQFGLVLVLPINRFNYVVWLKGETQWARKIPQPVIYSWGWNWDKGRESKPPGIFVNILRVSPNSWEEGLLEFHWWKLCISNGEVALSKELKTDWSNPWRTWLNGEHKKDCFFISASLVPSKVWHIEIIYFFREGLCIKRIVQNEISAVDTEKRVFNTW